MAKLATFEKENAALRSSLRDARNTARTVGQEKEAYKTKTEQHHAYTASLHAECQRLGVENQNHAPSENNLVAQAAHLANNAEGAGRRITELEQQLLQAMSEAAKYKELALQKEHERQRLECESQVNGQMEKLLATQVHHVFSAS